MRYFRLTTFALAIILCFFTSLQVVAQDNAEGETEKQQAKQNETDKTTETKIKNIRLVPPPPPDLTPKVPYLDEVFEYDKEHPAVGHWHGNAIMSNSVPSVAIEIMLDEAGYYTGKGSVAPGNTPNQNIDKLRVEGNNVSFDFPVYVAASEIDFLLFTGVISEDGHRLKGTVKVPDSWIKSTIDVVNARRTSLQQPVMTAEEEAEFAANASTATFELGRSPTTISLPEPKAYKGEIEVVEGFSFSITLVFAETPGGNWVGHIDIPQQNVAGWPLDKVVKTEGGFDAHLGAGAPAVFEGKLSEDGLTYAGDYVQMENRVPFTFKLVTDYVLPATTKRISNNSNPNRPQYPSQPFPYTASEITVKSGDIQTLAGTLTVPRGEGPFPTAILISSSGPHDRNHAVYGHESYLVLSDYLTRQGIAVIRYDDRGIGKSSGNFHNSTTQDFANDAAAVFDHLLTLENIDAEKIGYVGHGEGALVASLAALQTEGEAFVVMLGGIGVTGSAYEVSHTEYQLEKVEIDQTIKQALLDAELALYSAYAANVDDEELMSLAITYADAQAALAEALGRKPNSQSAVARFAIAKMKNTWRSFLLRIDPIHAISALECPIFACWGELDTQSIVSLNAPPIESAMKEQGGNLTLKIYPGMNHLFQPAETGDVTEYAKSKITMSEQVMRDIADWILALQK